MLHMEPFEYRKVLVYPVGQDGCRLIITEYYTWRNGERIQTKLTLKTAPPHGRPN